jgi:hypothetical protein
MQSDTFVAGFGRSDITPHPTFPSGMWMAQRHARGAGIHRKLYANCVAFGAGERRVLVLAFDLCILSHRQVGEIRSRVSDRTGVPADDIWLYCMHNHAGPVTQDFYDREGADEVRDYVAALPARSADAAESALAAARPAGVRGGSGTCRIGVNRDLVHEGRVVTGPNPGGFTDPLFDVLRTAAALAEAKWAKRANGARLRHELERKAASLPRVAAKPRYVVCAREHVDHADDVLAITAADIF